MGQSLLLRPDGKPTYQRTPEGTYLNVTPLNQSVVDSVVLEDCEDAWTVPANVTDAAGTPDYKAGTDSRLLTVATAFTTGAAAYENGLGDLDISGHDYITCWLKSDTAIAAGALALCISESDNIATPAETLAVTAMDADTWYHFLWPCAGASTTRNALHSVGLKIITDLSASADVKLTVDDIRAVNVNTVTAAGVETYIKRLIINQAGHANSRLRFITASGETIATYSGASTAPPTVEIGIISTDGLWIVRDCDTAPCPDFTVVYAPA